MLKRIPELRIRECLDDAASSPMAAAGIAYPRWYLHRWHFLPEGYLSRRSAVAYDALIRRIYNVAQEAHLHRALTGALALQHPRRVLELGSGPGNALAAIRQALPSAEVTGIDLSPFLLELAHDRLTGHEVALVHGDATRLPWPAGSFDAVVAQHYLGHLPPRIAPRAWEEATRILSPRGRLYVIDHAWHQRAAGSLIPIHSARLLGGLVHLDTLERPDGGPA